MRHKRVSTLVLICMALVCGALVSAASAKSYEITHVDIEARLHPDGSMDMTEERTYQFQGSYRFAYRDLPTGGPVTFENFTVSEGGRQYRLAGSEAPGTYNISQSSGRTRVTWYYKASNEARTFTFGYTALNAVQRYEDAAVLYYQFLSPDWAIPQNSINISLKPPTGLSRDQVREWFHGPLWARSQITQNGTILAVCEHLPGKTFLEVRALYPPEIFPEVPARPGTVRQGIMAEEAAWAEEANRRRQAAMGRWEAERKRMRLGKWVGGAVCLVGLLVWWGLYKTYHHKPELPSFLEMTSDIPGKMPPALLSYLLYHRQVAGSALVGTMLDLARRGFLVLREETEDTRSLWGETKQKTVYYWDLDRSKWEQEASRLADYENSLVAFIFNNLAEGASSISIEEIKKKRTAFVKFFGQWKKLIERHGKDKQWYDTESIRGMYISLAVGGVIIVGAILSIFLFRAWAMISLAGGCAVLGLSFLIPHRTAEGETKARQWNAVKRYLEKYEFRTADRHSLLTSISDYLVYGVVFGLSTKLYKELTTYIPANAHGTYVPWYVYSGTGAGEFSPASFSEAFSSMVATTTSAMSSASGAGGGASGGGGGGAGSGGGGAG
jgi:uncharacterized membrane protein